MSVTGVNGDLLVAGAGLLAGAVNAIAGGGTLISFPALLATGQSALSANITSTVALVWGWAGGTFAYRPELVGQRSRVVRLAVPALIGGVAGALLLLNTPAHAFRAIVPYLVLLACALLAAQPFLAKLLSRHRGRHERITADVYLVVLIGGIYGSYFGAGLGVALLALLGLLLADNLQRINALKGPLGFVVNLAGAAVFLGSGQVHWVHALILAVAAFIGATISVRFARRLDPDVLRYVVVSLGVVVAVVLIVHG
ncbi:MAG: sulfite exporter TauE/SafE family protein [Actinomycetes bacterium]